jgi:hypothetical protein
LDSEFRWLGAKQNDVTIVDGSIQSVAVNRQLPQDAAWAEPIPIVSDVWRVFAESFEGVDDEVDAVVTAIFIASADQVLTHGFGL